MTLAHGNIFQSIKGIILDVDGTLYHQTPVRLITVAMIMAHGVIRPGAMLPTVRTIRAWRKTLEGLRRQGPGFDVGARQLEGTVQAVNLPLPQVKQIVQKWMFDYPLGYLHRFRRAGLIEFLRSARESGMALGAYSDYPCRKKLARLGVLDYFSSVLSSWDMEVRSLKPDMRGFHAGCRALGTAPGQTLYIGDRPEVDGVGAGNSGMRPVIIGGKKPGITRRSGYYWADNFTTLANQLASDR